MQIIDLLETVSAVEVERPTTEISAAEESIETVAQPAINNAVRRAQSLGAVIRFYANIEPPAILIRGIKVGSIGFCFGVPKSGKTTLTEHLLLAIAAGRTEFLGYPLNCPNKVCLFVSFEENSWARIERNKLQLNDFTEDEQKNIEENYIVSTQDMPRYVMTPSDWLEFEEEIAFYHPGILVIDSLSRLTLDNNADESVAKTIMKKLREICVKYDCTVIIISHTPKGANEKQLSIASMSGSRIFMQEADFLIGVNRTITNSRYIKLVCARYDRDDCEMVDSFIINQNQCIEVICKDSEMSILNQNDGRVDPSNADAVYDEMVRIVDETQADTVKIDDIKNLYETGTMSKQTFYKSITKLIEKGKVKRMSTKGTYQVIPDQTRLTTLTAITGGSDSQPIIHFKQHRIEDFFNLN